VGNMKFKSINSTLIANCEDSAEYLSLVSGECELFSKENLRSLAQNRKLWALLSDISKKPVILFGEAHKPEIWKHIISAAWKEQYFVKGISGNLVAIPVKTSSMSVKEFSSFIEAIYAYGSEEGVEWSERALAVYQEYKEAA